MGRALAVVWDVLNTIIHAVVAFAVSLYAALPQSPLFVSTATVSELSTPIGYVAFFLPIVPMLAFLGLYVAGLTIWFLVVVTIHFVEQITP
jgi:hypothetical protein